MKEKSVYHKPKITRTKLKAKLLFQDAMEIDSNLLAACYGCGGFSCCDPNVCNYPGPGQCGHP